jgi:uncharacterized protein (TIGR03435 family)
MLATAAGVLLLCGNACGQTTAAGPEFDAAVVRLDKTGEDLDGGILPSGQFSVRGAPLEFLLEIAYKIKGEFITGFPAWARAERFQVIGEAPPHTPAVVLRSMLRTLLAHEFKLAAHEELRPQNGYALVVAKGGPRFQKAKQPSDPVTTEEDEQHCDRSDAHSQITAQCKDVSMAELAETLRDYDPGYLDRPVVDLTGLTATYDVKVRWTNRGSIDSDGGTTMFEAVSKQLGLKLDARKVKVRTLVIDHIERLQEN